MRRCGRAELPLDRRNEPVEIRLDLILTLSRRRLLGGKRSDLVLQGLPGLLLLAELDTEVRGLCVSR